MLLFFARRLSILLFAAFSFLSTNCNADSLRDIYELALKNDAKLRAAAATFRANRETEKQARSRLLPQIVSEGSHSTSNRRQDAFDNNLAGTSVVSTEIHSERSIRDTSWDVSLSQPLFDLPAWFSFKSGKSVSAQAEAQFAHEQQDLIVRVAEAYFDVLRAQDNLTTSLTEERAYKEQWEQAQSRFQSGVASITDVHEARAVYDASRARRIGDEGNRRAKYAALSVLTGLVHNELNPLPEKFPVTPPQPDTDSDWIKSATQNNYALKAATHAMEAAYRTTTAKRMEHMPKITGSLSYQEQDVDGNQNLRPDSPFVNPPDMEGRTRMAMVKVTMPIYSGGYASSQARQAYEQYQAALEQKIDTERTVMQNTLATFIAANTDVERIRAGREAITSAQAAVEASQAGYRFGTRSIVDVLQTQRLLFVSQRDNANARYDYVMNMLKLKQLAGLLSPQDVYELDKWLD